MYEDLSHVEEMVSMYLVLDKEDQTAIQKKVYTLYCESIHKEAVLQEQSKLPAKQRLSEKETHTEIRARTAKRMEKAIEAVDEIDKLSADKKAALLIALASIQKRTSKGNGKRPKVHITISDEVQSAKELVEDLFPEVDYESALKIYRETVTKIHKEEKTHE